VGVSPSLFDALIEEGLMPRPKRLHSRVLWDRQKLDAAFAALPGDDTESDECNVWDQKG